MEKNCNNCECGPYKNRQICNTCHDEINNGWWTPRTKNYKPLTLEDTSEYHKQLHSILFRNPKKKHRNI